MTNTPQENPNIVPQVLDTYTLNQAESISYVADRFGIKLSAVKDLYNVREGTKYSLVKIGEQYSLRANGKEVKRLTEENLFLPVYNFPAFGFSLRKNGYLYEVLDKNGTKTLYSIDTNNIDRFRAEFEKVGGVILTESYSRLMLKDLAHEVRNMGKDLDFPGTFMVNSKGSLDFLSTRIEMGKIGKLVRPEAKTDADQSALLDFFLSQLTLKK
jgi:hypothetical protein